MNKIIPLLYSLFFGLLPVLWVSDACLGNYFPEEFAAVAGCGATVLTFCWLGLFLLLRNPHRAGVMTLFLAGSFWSFMVVPQWTAPIFPGSPVTGSDTALALYAILTVGALWLLARAKLPYEKIALPLMTCSSVLFVYNVFPILAWELAVTSAVSRSMSAMPDQLSKIHPLSAQQPHPDVYYIIVDAFANAQTLQKYYNYDNSSFINHLTEKGFHLPSESRSNYDRTLLSIPSSLNMRYLDDLRRLLGLRYTAAEVNFRLIQHNLIGKIFQKLGYKYVNVASGFSPTEFVPDADVNLNYGGPLGTSLCASFVWLTPLQIIENHCHIVRDQFAARRRAVFENIQAIKAIPGPKFVLAHTLITHPPYIFDERGDKLSLPRSMLNQPMDNDKYLAQLKYTEVEITKLVDELLRDPAYQPIIIIQSDHGPQVTFDPTNQDCVQKRMRIINAYYLPGSASKLVYDTITPVNSFRLVFASLFGVDIGLLPDKCFMGPTEEHFRWTDVTDKIHFN